MTTPYFDELTPLRVDEGNFMVYKLLTADQRIAFGEMGLQIMARVKGFSKPQAFHLVFKLVEWYEKHFPQ
jgi:hypothetical protein